MSSTTTRLRTVAHGAVRGVDATPTGLPIMPIGYQNRTIRRTGATIMPAGETVQPEEELLHRNERSVEILRLGKRINRKWCKRRKGVKHQWGGWGPLVFYGMIAPNWMERRCEVCGRKEWGSVKELCGK